MEQQTPHVQQEMQPLHSRKHKNSFFKRHGLSVIATGVLLLWVVLYMVSSDQTHWGSFFGNAIADWSGGDDIGDQASL